MRVILASQSPARRAMLSAAGIPFEAVVSGVDEGALRASLAAAGGPMPPARVAAALAAAKAEAVSRLHPGALVIGSDQVLDLDGDILEKPDDLAAARASLLRLRGRAHILWSAVALMQDGDLIWSETDQARLVMRSFSDGFLERYLESAGARVLGSVGAYELEGQGIQLFERIDGQYFTILGMPLLPLIGALRARGVITA